MEKVGALSGWRDSPHFDSEESLALEYAEAMTITGREVDDTLRSGLQERWNDDAILSAGEAASPHRS